MRFAVMMQMHQLELSVYEEQLGVSLASVCCEVFKCPLCPFRSFGKRKDYLRTHIAKHHTLRNQFVCSGTKQLKVATALFDNDCFQGPQRFRKRSCQLHKVFDMLNGSQSRLITTMRIDRVHLLMYSIGCSFRAQLMCLVFSNAGSHPFVVTGAGSGTRYLERSAALLRDSVKPALQGDKNLIDKDSDVA